MILRKFVFIDNQIFYLMETQMNDHTCVACGQNIKDKYYQKQNDKYCVSCIQKMRTAYIDSQKESAIYFSENINVVLTNGQKFINLLSNYLQN